MDDKNTQEFLTRKHKDISRVDQVRPQSETHGWFVRVRYKGGKHSKFFSDKKYSGKYPSLISAIAWRDKKEKRLGKVRTDKPIVMVTRSTTGVVGVRLNEKLNRYEISWVDAHGKQGKTSVSITRHGKKKAFSRACAIRREKEMARLGIVEKK